MVKVIDLSEEKRKKIEKEKELTDIIVKELPTEIKVDNTENCSTISSLKNKKPKPIISTKADEPCIYVYDKFFF